MTLQSVRRYRQAIMGMTPQEAIAHLLHVLDTMTEPGEESVEAGALYLDGETLGATWNGRRVRLTLSEWRVMAALAQRPGVIKRRDQLIAVIDAELGIEDRTIDSHMKRLRKKFLAVDPKFGAIQTVYGLGYRFSLERSMPERGPSGQPRWAA